MDGSLGVYGQGGILFSFGDCGSGDIIDGGIGSPASSIWTVVKVEILVIGIGGGVIAIVPRRRNIPRLVNRDGCPSDGLGSRIGDLFPNKRFRAPATPGRKEDKPNFPSAPPEDIAIPGSIHGNIGIGTDRVLI